MLLLLTSLGCTPTPPKETGTAPVDTAGEVVDADGDGVPASADCDDENEYAYPGADEVPYDGKDQDCDGEDENDVDGDGYVGDNGGGDDCNDANPDVHPGAEVICYDAIDEDCTEGWSQYDCDSDGYDVTEDCGDEDPAVFPGAEDVWYDGVDSDCDARDDFDQDGDGFPSSEYPDPDDTSVSGSDCDDLDATVNVDADEIWDGRDNDCADGIDAMTNRTATASWTGDGFSSDGAFGSDFASLGDPDGDGVVDIAVGVVGYADYVGKAYVLPYDEGLNLPSDDALAMITGSSYFGNAVTPITTPAGDFLAIGEPGAFSVHLFEAASLTGGAELTTADAAAAITSSSLLLGGELDTWTDGEGGQSLFVSSLPYEEYGAFVAVFPGAALSSSVAEDAATWTWSATGDIYDGAVLTDFDGDGLDEIGVATSGYGGAARAYLATGALVAEGGADTSTSSITGFAGQLFLAGAPDLDGDGYEDYLVSDVEADGGGSAAGVVWVIGGPDAIEGGDVEEIASATISGATDSGGLRAASSQGDLDEDGAVDVLVCAPGDGESGVEGACGWVSAADLAGGGDHSPGTTAPTFASGSADDLYGGGARVEDFDGDGDDDVWISATTDAGALYIYLNE